METTLGGPFRRLWAASGASNLADGVAIVAWPWLASTITRDPLALAAIGVLAGLPWLVFSLPVGVWIDRLDRGRLIATCDFLRAAILLIVTAAVAVFGSQLGDPVGVTPAQFDAPPHQAAWLALLYVATLGLGIIEVVRDSAAQAFLPTIVEKAQLERANGRLMTTEIITNSLAGPPLAGFLVAIALLLPFAGNTGAYLLAAVLVFTIGARPRPKVTNRRFGAELKVGLRWLWQHSVLRHLAIILGLANFSSSLGMATAILFAQEVLGVDGPQYGLMLTGGAVGGVLGGVLAARIGQRVGPGKVINGSMLVFGSVFILVSQMNSWPAVWALMVIETFAVLVWNVVTVSLRQRIIPDDLFGRVNSVYRFLSWGAIPLGTLLGGLVVTLAEPGLGREAALRAPFLVAGVMPLLAVPFSLRWLNNRTIAAATS